MGKGEGAKNKTSRQATTGTADVKIGMAKMLKGGVIMDVIDAEQARIVRYRCRTLANLCAAFYQLPELLGRTARRRRARAESERQDAAPRRATPRPGGPRHRCAGPRRTRLQKTPQTQDHTHPAADR
jgi:hypothetical protein